MNMSNSRTKKIVLVASTAIGLGLVFLYTIFSSDFASHNPKDLTPVSTEVIAQLCDNPKEGTSSFCDWDMRSLKRSTDGKYLQLETIRFLEREYPEGYDFTRNAICWNAGLGPVWFTVAGDAVIGEEQCGVFTQYIEGYSCETMQNKEWLTQNLCEQYYLDKFGIELHNKTLILHEDDVQE